MNFFNQAVSMAKTAAEMGVSYIIVYLKRFPYQIRDEVGSCFLVLQMHARPKPHDLQAQGIAAASAKVSEATGVEIPSMPTGIAGMAGLMGGDSAEAGGSGGT
jgi:hypothetical protein